MAALSTKDRASATAISVSATASSALRRAAAPDAADSLLRTRLRNATCASAAASRARAS